MALDSLIGLGADNTSMYSVRVRFRPGVHVERVEPGTVELVHPWGKHRIPVSEPVVSVLQRFAGDGVDLTMNERDIDGTAASGADVIAIAQTLWVANEIEFVLSIELFTGADRLLGLEPAGIDATIKPAVARDRPPVLSRFAFFRPAPGGITLESATASYRAHMSEPLARILLSAFMSATMPQPEPDRAMTAAATAMLGAAGFLEDADAGPRDGFGGGIRQMGELHDILLHRRSRLGRWDGAFGAAFPYLGSIESPDAVPRATGNKLVELIEPSWDAVIARDRSLTEVLEGRVSARLPGSRPLTLAELGEFLFRCARVRRTFGPSPETGLPYVAVDRPFPAGGGVHDLELYPVAVNVGGLSPGSYHYLAGRNCLEACDAAPDALDALLAGAMRASGATRPPQVLVVITSRILRMAWKYRAITYATVLKNVGVLYQTMYLVATAMYLRPCALGSGDDVAADRAFGLTERNELAVGEFMLNAGDAPDVEFQPLRSWPER
jgi:SagB-type dehydrogenase family enzyme